MNVQIIDSWKNILQSEFDKEYFSKLNQFIKNEYHSQIIYPTQAHIWEAFNKCPLENIKVVIIGQDPYHGPNQANGLCFSVNDESPIPPSLLNIFKEIERDLHIPIPKSGNLERWAQQGVLLLNSVLSVRSSQAASHQGKGWETFTNAVIQLINAQKQNVVYMLWGAYAQKKGSIIDESKNLILKSVHPSPLSAYKGFIGCEHFSQANHYLKSHHKSEIKW